MSLESTLTRPETSQPESGVRFTVKPAFQVREKEDAYNLSVALPGVAKDALEITAEEDNLVVRGRRSAKTPGGWTPLHVESVDADFELVLAHENAFDVDKIAAELHDGVLHVTLPKTAALKPRKIPVS